MENIYKTMKKPILSKIGVLGIVPDYWGETWQVRQQVLTRLSKYFQVIWLNRPNGWREYWLPNANVSKESIPDSYGNMTIYSPGKWLPQVYRPERVGKYIERLRLIRAIKILRAKGCERILLYIWRPEFGTALDMVEYDLSFYHIDDEYTFTSEEQGISAEEFALIRRVDQVFIHSPALMTKKGHLNKNTQYISNGVDYKAFSTKVAEPEDMKNIPYPRIGYMGIIKDQLDFQMLSDLVDRHPYWSFVFVGPKRNISTIENYLLRLESKNNVFFLGGKQHEELPGYAQHFDVCTLCYKIDGYTKFIYPLKINEYLASGRPVVGVPIPSIELFKEVVKIARTPKEWSEAIAACLSIGENTKEKSSVRMNVAKQCDWNRQVFLIAKTMCEHLGRDYTEKLESYSEIIH